MADPAAHAADPLTEWLDAADAVVGALDRLRAATVLLLAGGGKRTAENRTGVAATTLMRWAGDVPPARMLREAADRRAGLLRGPPPEDRGDDPHRTTWRPRPADRAAAATGLAELRRTLNSAGTGTETR